MDIETLIAQCQAAVGVKVDRRPGIDTWTAIHRRLVPQQPAPAPAQPSAVPTDRVDDRSERVIATLHPKVQPYARALVQSCASRGITIKVISGHRSYAEQDALFRQCCDGKDNDGDGRTDEADERVTRAKGGYSNHNFGLAFDIGVFNGSNYLAESPAYKAVGAIGMSLGLDWGGNWKSIVDEPHFQLRPDWADHLSESDMLAGLRERVASGKDVFAS